MLKVFDPQHEVRLIVDASDYCIGSVLEQSVEDQSSKKKTWHPVEFYSKRSNQAD